MTRTTLFSFAAVAMIAVACERHPASELEAEHGHGGASHAAPSQADPHRAPAEVPSNPAGAAPVSSAAGEGKGVTSAGPAVPADKPPADKSPSFFK